MEQDLLKQIAELRTAVGGLKEIVRSQGEMISIIKKDLYNNSIVTPLISEGRRIDKELDGLQIELDAEKEKNEEWLEKWIEAGGDGSSPDKFRIP